MKKYKSVYLHSISVQARPDCDGDGNAIICLDDGYESLTCTISSDAAAELGRYLIELSSQGDDK